MNPKANKIILVQPKATNHGGFRAPLNLLQLATPLIHNGFEVKIIDFHIERPSNHDLRKYFDNALFIGISAFTGLQSSEAIKFAQLARSINHKIPLIWGGYHPSLWPELALASNLVDYVIVGPGEKALLELAQSLSFNNPPRSRLIVGLEISDIPSPSWDLVNLRDYIDRTVLANRVLNIITSYGCPHRCSFCAVSNVFSHQWNAKPPAQVVDEVSYLISKYQIDGLEFSDNAPFIDNSRMVNIADEFIRRNFKISWMSMARADELNGLSSDEWRILVRSGFKRVFIGVESGDDDVLKVISKNQSVEQYLTLAENCAKYGVVPDFSFTLGYPPDPSKDIELSIKLIRKLKEIVPNSTIILYRYTPYCYDERIKEILNFPSCWEDWMREPWSLYSLTSSIHPWLKRRHISRINEFETVMTCAHYRDERIFPQSGTFRWLMNVLVPIAKIRWGIRFYSFPYELKLLRRLFLALNKENARGRIAT